MPDLYSRRSFIAGVLTAGMLSTAAGYLLTRRTPVKLTLVTGADNTGGRNLLINLWNRFHPDVTIEVVTVNSATQDQYDKFISTKADIYNLDVIHIPRFSARDRITPIGPPDGITLLAPVQRVSQVDNDPTRLWAVPFNTDVGMLYRRVTDKLAADTETALDAVIRENGQFVGQLAIEGSVTDEAFVINVLEQALAQDRTILDDRGVVSTSLGQWQRALRPLADALRENRIVTAAGEENTNALFQQRDLRYMRNWPVWYPAIDRVERKKPGTAAIRLGRLPIGILGGQGLAVAKDSEHREEAEAVIHFLTGMPAQKLLATYGFAPTAQEAYNDPEVKAAVPHLEIVRSAVEDAHPRPMRAGYADFARVFRQHTYDYLYRRVELTDGFVEGMQGALR
ncbi:extracellular solute-binding protein [Actinoplanes regularis]|uniref:Multiple sugar transport system substrate-binding protein n=1 Tax=Actinoplanes regularis TaxID=52697 RepID=A0A238WPV7_9ACTN|nr:extracellular solute-binding protein [Actinoplanes regularis]GIE84645.1 ABC transporter substrate-binding protein [Actinoplanes regularis]GLW33027.1 ABC transporter substrate-binding protein [Actinoplanes regularis]SNR48586.1 multiple sugar transport system substrate-binding protein [Actinoplanes regularis]